MRLTAWRTFEIKLSVNKQHHGWDCQTQLRMRANSLVNLMDAYIQYLIGLYGTLQMGHHFHQLIAEQDLAFTHLHVYAVHMVSIIFRCQRIIYSSSSMVNVIVDVNTTINIRENFWNNNCCDYNPGRNNYCVNKPGRNNCSTTNPCWYAYIWNVLLKLINYFSLYYSAI